MSSQTFATNEMSQVVLSRVRKGMSMSIGQMAIDTLQLREEYAPWLADKIVSATFDVLADKILEDKYTTYFTWKTPTNWKQQLKKDHAPKWFNKRYPVQYENHTYRRNITFTRHAEYPKANVAIPKESRLFIAHLGNLEVIRDSISETGKQL